MVQTLSWLKVIANYSLCYTRRTLSNSLFIHHDPIFISRFHLGDYPRDCRAPACIQLCSRHLRRKTHGTRSHCTRHDLSASYATYRHDVRSDCLFLASMEKSILFIMGSFLDDHQICLFCHCCNRRDRTDTTNHHQTLLRCKCSNFSNRTTL